MVQPDASFGPPGAGKAPMACRAERRKMGVMRFLARASLLSVALLAGCANLNLYSDEQLEPLSVAAYDEACGQYPVVESGPDYDLVQEVARRITRAADEDFPWQARLLKADDVPNAFCLPNGRIAVYTGILPLCRDASGDPTNGLAAVLGHEVAHATMRHGGKRMTQSALSNVAMEIANLGLGMTDMTANQKGTLMTVLGAGAQYGVMLPFSRDHETEADVVGMRYAIRAGFDPWEAPRLWERMAAMAGGSRSPEWMSTHPDPKARAEKLRQLIPTLLEEEKNWQPKPTKKVDPGAVGR